MIPLELELINFLMLLRAWLYATNSTVSICSLQFETLVTNALEEIEEIGKQEIFGYHC